MALSKRLDKIIKGLEVVSTEKFYIDIVKDLDRELEDYQRFQMLKGQTNTGDLITPKYTKWTKANKAGDPSYKAPFGTPNLKNTGNFQDSIFAKVSSGFVKFGATDSKTSGLMDKYKNIFGLNSMTLEEFIKDVLTPVTVERIDVQFN